MLDPNHTLYVRTDADISLLKPNGNGNMNQQKGPGSGAPSPTIPYGPSLPPAMPALNTSGSFAPSADASSPQVENQSFNHNQAEPMEKEKPKYFFNPKFAKLGVKGNFMPLAAQPKNVDIAEWLAHHCMDLSLQEPKYIPLIIFFLCRYGAVPSSSCLACHHPRSRHQHRHGNLQPQSMSRHVCWPVSASAVPRPQPLV